MTLKTKEFRGTSQAEAEEKALAWVRANPGVTVKDSRAVSLNVRGGGAPADSGRWHLVLQYEEAD